MDGARRSLLVRRGRLLAGAVALLVGLGVPDAATAGAELRPLRGPDGNSVALAAPPRGVSVLIFYSSECPISNAYSPTLNGIAKAYPRERVRFVGVCVDPDLSDADISTHAKDFQLAFPVARDRFGSLSAALGATMSPEAFVIDDAGAIRYHGRIDDQFVARRQPNANPVTHELKDAIEAVLAGQPVAKPFVAAIGCPIPEHPDRPKTPPTYAREVARILQKNCQECHRPGQVGPFPLLTYEHARKRADDIASVVADRAMPPWKPVGGFSPRMKHDRSLSSADIATLAAWAEAGAPEGDPADLPPPATFPEGWTLGTPDLVIEPAVEFPIPADGPDVYRCFVIPTNLPYDAHVVGIEYQPGNRKVVHHILSFVDTSGEARKKDAADPGLGYACFSGPEVPVRGDLGGWAPGNRPSRLPEGIGRSLPKGADVVVQVHYHPSGKPEADRTRIGLYLAKGPIRQTLHWAAAADLGLKIPAGESNHPASGTWEVPVDLVAHAVTPHMHLLGRDMTMTVRLPDGRERPLIMIDDWDFSWQDTYTFETPIELPKGSIVKMSAHFDNSSTNPRNPNKPPREVTWGEATTDEMAIGFIAVTKKGQDLTRPGAVDDLRAILDRQEQELRERYEREARRRAEEAEARSESANPRTGPGR